MSRCYGTYRYDAANTTWKAGGTYEDIYFIAMEPVAVSSSEIRKLVSLNQPVEQYIPDKVNRYIKEKKLYNQ